MLVSNIGLTMNTHFCGGYAVESTFSLGLANLDCGMPDMEQACDSEKTDSPSIKPIPCCENQHQVLEVDENLETHSPTIEINPDFLFAFVLVSAQPELFAHIQADKYREYTPPFPDLDRQVLFESFLI